MATTPSRIGQGSGGSQEAVSYAQFGEDTILRHMFPKAHGTFVEVGAFDGITGSATYALETSMQWTGVLVEANPELAEKCRQLRKSSSVIECAAVAPGCPRHVDFQLATLDGQLSSLKISKDQMRRVPNRDTKSISVLAMTLDEILDASGIREGIDVVTIDVEGFEWNVLQGFSINLWRPSVVIVENNAHFIDRRVSRYFHSNGYAIHAITGVNVWWIHVGSNASRTLNLLREFMLFTAPRIVTSPKAILRHVMVQAGILR